MVKSQWNRNGIPKSPWNLSFDLPPPPCAPQHGAAARPLSPGPNGKIWEGLIRSPARWGGLSWGDGSSRVNQGESLIIMETSWEISWDIWVCLKMLCTPKPNGFADHDPVFKWLAIIGNINPTSSDKPIWDI